METHTPQAALRAAGVPGLPATRLFRALASAMRPAALPPALRKVPMTPVRA
jgi:hypothetical protein